MTRAEQESGFAIVEAIAAAAILATTLVGVAHVLAVATTASAGAGDVTFATFSAAGKLEELRAAPYAEAAVHGEDRVDERFSRRWRITPIPTVSAVAIVVEVTPVGGRASGVRLETIRARP